MKLAFTSLVLCFLYTVHATVFFKEVFDEGWKDRWVESTKKGAEQGKWGWTAGKFFKDENDKGLKTTEDARFYGISSKFDKFSNKNKPLVVQFSVKHEQGIDCGGGYVKLFADDLDQTGMHGDSPYNIMFGPDICGYSTKKVHVIFTYKDKNLLTKKDIKCKDDELTHVYTLVVNPDNTYEVKIDDEKVESGSLEEDWDFLPAKEIKDPEAKKPEDWDDNEKIDDPTDTKPDDWDVPQTIADAEAKKPDDWDDEMDGEWEPPMVDNPDYKGEWSAKQIDNPNYKGKWVHPMIANPDYAPDDSLYSFPNIGALGFDLWQVKSGSIFDNVFIGDDASEASAFAQETWGAMKDEEKSAKEAADEIQRKKDEEEAKAREAEEGATKEGEDGADDEDIDGDEPEDESHDEL